MFTGVSLDQALRYWKNGKEVIVLDRTVKSPSGGYETYSLDELFKNLELLVDVPAIRISIIRNSNKQLQVWFSPIRSRLRPGHRIQD